MTCLAVQWPFSASLVRGIKTCEMRGNELSVSKCGIRVFIYETKSMRIFGKVKAKITLPYRDLPRNPGCIIGSVTFSGSVHTSLMLPSDVFGLESLADVDYDYAWRVCHSSMLRQPVPIHHVLISPKLGVRWSHVCSSRIVKLGRAKRVCWKPSPELRAAAAAHEAHRSKRAASAAAAAARPARKKLRAS